MSNSTARKQNKGRYRFRIKQREFHYDDRALNQQEYVESFKQQSNSKASEVDYEESKDKCNKVNLDEESGSISHFSKRSNKEVAKRSELKELIDEIKLLRKELAGFISKIANPLERIASKIETIHTSPYFTQNDLKDHNIYKINEDDQQSEVVFHQVEDYETIRELYPFEKFKRDELNNLGPISKKEYQRLFKLAESYEPLAYFLYQNRSLTQPTMKSFILTFKEYFVKHDKFNLTDLKLLYVEKDMSEVENKETIKRKWKQWRRLATVVYGVRKEDFPVVKFSSKKKGKEQNHSAYDRELILDAWKTLSNKGNKVDALLLHLMFALALRPGEARLLKFEDVLINNNQMLFKVYKSKKDRIQQLTISKELYNEIISYKQYLIDENKYVESNRKTSKGDMITGHFIFNNSRNVIGNKFKSWFGGVIPDFKLRPKDMRIAAISDRNIHGSLVEAAALADHRNTAITTGHYTRSALILDSNKSKHKLKKN